MPLAYTLRKLSLRLAEMSISFNPYFYQQDCSGEVF